MASTYLTRTFGSAGNRQSWTWSAWIKKSKIYNSTSSSDREVWFGGYTASNDTEWLEFGTQGDAFYFTTSATANTGNRLMRDPNGWFHAVVTYDGSNIKFYYNNELDFNNTQISGNRGINVAGVHTIGAVATNQSIRRFNGLMSHVHFVDGAILAPTVFGETDSVTGEWKIIVEPTVSSYGTNGFFILKDGNSLTDQSPNSNNFTANGTLTKTEDCPSNVFATFNSLEPQANGFTLENGNLSTNGNSSNTWRSLFGTLANTSGKFYYECKIATGYADSGNAFEIGVADIDQVSNSNSKFAGLSRGYAYQQSGNKLNNNSGTSYGSRIYIGSIVCVAVDLDNNKIYFRRDNNAWENGGNPTSGSTGTGSAFDLASGYTYAPAFATYYSADDLQLNFGNGYFGTTAVSSNSGNGYSATGSLGIFQYQPPTGYTALCTKGLNL